ncbi:hypothetical protein BpHYR1_019307 [Brachionus plicatilis]|uniref:Uncharacterized protein n=1 Tax=Brachionus plicatilis TaxID=10195 RepID=A0A3M7RH44_BRAPC|nr:hypothetical protein BpHYR1_019307 [Brachionus plicatilis]
MDMFINERMMFYSRTIIQLKFGLFFSSKVRVKVFLKNSTILAFTWGDTFFSLLSKCVCSLTDT